MINEDLFPLERNRYFFGKLMTEREYDKEQAYFNNKRRLINAAVMGSGVVCGFVVTKVDGATIAVESGLAFDGLGRELAANQVIVTRLSALNGFSADRGLAPYVYLCAEYAETPVEPVRAMSGGTGAAQFGYVRETVRLFLRYGEPEPFEIAHPDADGRRAESLESMFERAAREQLYLAKIYLIRWEEAYEIDRIEQLPFRQYASMPVRPDAAAPAVPPETRRLQPPAHPENRLIPPAVTFGMAEIVIPKNAKPGSLHYSDDITHNLGLVPVTITLGYSIASSAIFGDAAIFNESADFDYAARVRVDNGTFQIGVRNIRAQARTLRFVWSAAAEPACVGAEEPSTARILVDPPFYRMKTLETVQLTAKAYGLPDLDPSWSVRERGGGDITRAGVYTAPADPGVFTVAARIENVSGQAVMVVQ